METNVMKNNQFWSAVTVLLNNFSSVNKRISNLKILNILQAKRNIDFLLLCKKYSQACEEINQNSEAFLPLCGINILTDLTQLAKNFDRIVLIVRIIKKQRHVASNVRNGIIGIDFNRKTCFFFTYGEGMNFELIYKEGEILAKPLSSFENVKDMKWFVIVLQTKLRKWATSELNSGYNNIGSLRLVDVEEYNIKYALLKEKYGKHLIEIWPECTNPSKYVYEDIAIATYLILLWERTSRPKGFVDLGCGNGLLVFILKSEGFLGHGIDIRKRKLWDVFPSFEEVITPHNLPKYESIDWIIGNHSDELSPWIPVIAKFNSYDTKYFLLPCCAYELNGEKFQRRNSKVSVYHDFLQYLEEITLLCGFKNEIDRLKIPSTKRIAYIGIERTYKKSEFEENNIRIKNLLTAKVNNTNVRLRQKEEPVRNCTQIEKSITNKIVLKIVDYLLFYDKNEKSERETWRTGRTAFIRDIADYINSGELKKIKNECGGIKTLIKNNHEIFEIKENQVKLRLPKKKNSLPILHTVKKRSCFFYNNHPDGCPLTGEDCSFLHEDNKTS